MRRSIATILCIVFFGAMVCELHAPEITPAVNDGYYYQVGKDGSICDSNGVIRGWVLGSRVYDNQWRILYELKDGRIWKISDDMAG